MTDLIIKLIPARISTDATLLDPRCNVKWSFWSSSGSNSCCTVLRLHLPCRFIQSTKFGVCIIVMRKSLCSATIIPTTGTGCLVWITSRHDGGGLELLLFLLFLKLDCDGIYNTTTTSTCTTRICRSYSSNFFVVLFFCSTLTLASLASLASRMNFLHKAGDTQKPVRAKSCESRKGLDFRGTVATTNILQLPGRVVGRVVEVGQFCSGILNRLLRTVIWDWKTCPWTDKMELFPWFEYLW